MKYVGRVTGSGLLMRIKGLKSKRLILEAIEPRLLLSKTVYVDANAAGAVHDGASWNTAFVDHQQGLAAAVSGDEIHVADGTYVPSSALNTVLSFNC